jgi:ABC-type transport system substrate-binding protein
MRKTKGLWFVAMIIALVVSGNAVYAGGEADGGAAVGKTVVIGMDQEPETLDASTNTLHLVRWCTDPIFGRLVWLDETGTEIIPAIAESWTFVKDTEIEFKLRDDVVFHNGRPLVAEDVVYCLDVQRDKDYGGVRYSSFAPYVESIDAPDDYTVVVNLKSPYPAILSIIVQLPIFAPETVDTIATAPVGCGPFKFVSWDKNQTLKMEAFEDYYEEGVPSYQNLTYNFYAEYNTCLTAYMSGEVDIINWMSPIDVPTIEGLGDSYTQAGLAGIYYFQGKMTQEPFNKPGVMRALALGVDREEMNELVLDSKGMPAWLPQHPESVYYPKDVEYQPDLARAKQLLAEAGYPNGFTAKLLAPLTAVEGVLAEVMQAQLAEIGVTIELEVLEVPAFLEKWRGGDFELAICGHGFEIDPSIQLNRWMTDDTRNFGQHSNQVFDQLCAEATVTVDVEKRKDLYYDAYHMFIEDAAISYLIAENRYSAIRNNIKGLIKRTAFNDFTRLTVE